LFRPGTLALSAVVATLSGLFLYAFDPAQGGPYPVCYFHQTTGLLCPGCGCLRALHQLLHGHLAAAFYFNPLMVLSLPCAAWAAAWSALRVCRGRPVAFVFCPAWFWGAGGLLLLFGILRNLPWRHWAWLGLRP